MDAYGQSWRPKTSVYSATSARPGSSSRPATRSVSGPGASATVARARKSSVFSPLLGQAIGVVRGLERPHHPVGTAGPIRRHLLRRPRHLEPLAVHLAGFGEID